MAAGGTGQTASAGGDTTVTAKTGAHLRRNPPTTAPAAGNTYHLWNVNLDGVSRATTTRGISEPAATTR